MINYDKFEKALRHLALQYHNRDVLDPEQPLLIREAVDESVIQRFETCYDCLWKVLKRYLLEELGIPDVPNSPKPVIRLAGENKLFASPVDQWMAYAQARINTAHDYSGEKATDALELMDDFIRDAIRLYETMSRETWA
ncbi:MAG: nucleotidyltransferase substrate binding protein [Candidatus Hydrogenedentes bacterium]|nr:nucleotidyltransferase substrate binding protein [Candidatus Hydrogenedentota bacterium]